MKYSKCNTKNWQKTLLPSTATIKEAIRCLDESAMRIVLVVDAGKRLLGTVSDGDIRRGLLKGLDLMSPISQTIQKTPFVVTPDMERALVLQLMTANKIQQIPVVDEKNRVLGLHLWDEITLPPSRRNIMVIMAGGLGRRLLPLTETCPKPMIQVAGKPMLEHIIERAKNEGFRRFVLAIHYLGKIIESHFGNGERNGVQIEYLKEKVPLGTAGALSLLNRIPDSPFLVTNGDVLADIRYGEMIDFHIKQSAFGTMAVRAHEIKQPFGVVQTKGLEIIDIQEKPINRNYINAGVYALSQNALNLIRKNESLDMTTLFNRMIKNSKKIVAYPIHENWLDIGNPGDLLKAEKKIIK